ncbi:hypothetical protein C2S51_015080 [Perilla frutescens var. frutescens]|nr:hypothetical protein C2S51_015080 [Perilla frutescens var. frutescens]
MTTGQHQGRASSSSTRTSTASEIRVVCPHHGGAEMYLSNTHKNPCRRFVRCPERNELGCDFFSWVDDELTPHYLASVQRMKMEMGYMEAQLKCKAELIGVLYEKIGERDTELERLRGHALHTVNRDESPKHRVWPVACLVAAFVMFYLAFLLKDLSFA